MIVLKTRGPSLSSTLEQETSAKRLGTSSKCLQLRDLHRASIVGWTPNEYAHIKECEECRVGYSNFMKIKRNEARMALKLDPYEDVAERAFGVRVPYKLG